MYLLPSEEELNFFRSLGILIRQQQENCYRLKKRMHEPGGWNTLRSNKPHRLSIRFVQFLRCLYVPCLRIKTFTVRFPELKSSGSRSRLMGMSRKQIFVQFCTGVKRLKRIHQPSNIYARGGRTRYPSRTWERSIMVHYITLAVMISPPIELKVVHCRRPVQFEVWIYAVLFRTSSSPR